LESDWKIWLMYVPHLLYHHSLESQVFISLIYDVTHRHLFENATLFALLVQVVWLLFNITLSRSLLSMLWLIVVSTTISVATPLSIKKSSFLVTGFCFCLFDDLTSLRLGFLKSPFINFSLVSSWVESFWLPQHYRMKGVSSFPAISFFHIFPYQFSQIFFPRNI
jgi:hypothetical protein